MLQSQGSPSGRGSLPTPQFHTLGGGGSGGKEGGGEGEGGSGGHEASTEVNNDEVFDLPGGLADLADPGVGGSIVSGHGGSGFGTATLTATASGSEGTTGAGAGGGGGGSGGAGVGGFGGDNPGVLLGGILHHDPSVNLRLLESSYRNLPQPGDGVWTRRRRERPHVPIPPSYPTQLPPVLENPALFERLDADALFFTFYYQQGTAQQYLAARELKRANWRFHKKYATWFARQEEPAVSTDLYEQGSYIYFDFTLNAGANDGSNAPGGWCQRSKADFVFEYQQLESEMN
jgi:CCR4-NOT transcription complex subunit 3